MSTFARHFFTVAGFVGLLVFGVIACELAHDGFWFLMLDAVEVFMDQMVEAFRWVAAFGAAVYAGIKIGKHVGHRDALQEVSQATAAEDRRLTEPRLLRAGDN